MDFSCGVAIESHEFLHEVCACLLPAGDIACEIREAKFGDRAVSYLLLEEIDLV